MIVRAGTSGRLVPRMLARTLQSAALAASILAGSLVVLTLYLNPALQLRDGARGALRLGSSCPTLLAGTAVLLAPGPGRRARALAAGSAGRPCPACPGSRPSPCSPPLVSAALYWLNLWEYRHSIPLELLRAHRVGGGRVRRWRSCSWRWPSTSLFFPARSRAPAAALLIVGPALAVAVPLALRPARPEPRARPGGHRALRPQRRIVLFGVDGLSPDLLKDALARGPLPVFARLLKRGAHGPLATLRPTEAPPLWTTILTGRLPRDHGVKSFATYHLWGSPGDLRAPAQLRLRELAGADRARHHEPRHLGEPQAPGALERLNAFGIPPASCASGAPSPPSACRASCSRTTSTCCSTTRRARRRPSSPGPPAGGAARAVAPADVDRPCSWSSWTPRRETTPFPWRRELVERALAPDLTYQRAGSVLRAAYDPPFFATYFYGLDVVGHAFLRFAQPERFGDVRPEEVRRYGRVLDRYLALVGQWIGEAEQGLGPDDVLLVVSGYGHGARAALAAALRAAAASVAGPTRAPPTGSSSPWATASGRGRGSRARPCSTWPPPSSTSPGLPVARDMEGRVLTEMLEDDFARAHPVTFIPSYESLAVTTPPAPPWTTCPPCPTRCIDVRARPDDAASSSSTSTAPCSPRAGVSAARPRGGPRRALRHRRARSRATTTRARPIPRSCAS